jgi:hypothetical protein
VASFYEQFFSEPMPERQRIAEQAGMSLQYVQKHTYVQGRNPKFHFHNAVGLDRASNGKLRFIDMTEGDIDWAYVLERLKLLQKHGLVGRKKLVPLPTAQFATFWDSYPRKVNKPGALRSWRAQGCDRHLIDIMKDMNRRMLNGEWTKDYGRYVPHPTTYINQRRWEEVLDIPSPAAETFAGAV